MSGYAVSAPVWSPTEARFALLTSTVADPANIVASIVDVDNARTATYDVPDYPLTSQFFLTWSRSGTYVTYTIGVAADGSSSPLTILNGATGEPSSVSQQGFSLQPVTWSINDQDVLLVLTSVADATSQPTLAVYSIKDQNFRSMAVGADLGIKTAEWQPGNLQLGVVAQSISTGRYSLSLLDLGANTQTTLLDTSNTLFTLSNIAWSGDGSHIVFLAPSDDPLFSSLGTVLGLYTFDVHTSETIRLSPVGYIVNSLHVRPF